MASSRLFHAFLSSLALLSGSFAHAQGSSPDKPVLSGIVAFNDLHLYDSDSSLEPAKALQNRLNFERMIDTLKSQSSVTDVILNGDLYHAPSVLKLNRETRIQRAVDLLIYIQRAIGKPLYFNLGNHDLEATSVNGKYILAPGYAEEFARRLSASLEADLHRTGTRPEIHLIGLGQAGFGDYHSVFDLTVRGLKIKISHAPFIKTARIAEQAEYFHSTERAYQKVQSAPLLSANRDGTYYLQADSHTPLDDPELRVYNSGMLTVDDTLPYRVSTFLMLSKKGSALYSIPREPSAPITPFIPPGCDPEIFKPH